jgi:acyl dehydratase
MSTSVTATSDPVIGEELGPKQLVASTDLIRAYVNSVGDEGFARHAAAMRLATGKSMAPPTLFDRDLGTRLFSSKYTSGYSLHAKQTFEFRRPLEAGVTYTIAGKLAKIYTRNEIDYATVEAACVTPGGETAVVSEYTRAFRFPENRYKHKPADRMPPTVASFLEQHRANPGAAFPAVGSVLEGVSRQMTQALMNLYSGPGSNIHTDVPVARRRGHPDAIVQGLMTTALECELYREVFGGAWYTTGTIAVKYIDSIIANACLTPLGIVVANTGGRLELRTTVYNERQELLTVGSASVKIQTNS